MTREGRKEERLARLTAEKRENSGQDAHNGNNPTAKLPSNHTPTSAQIRCFSTETIRRVIEKFKAESRTFPGSYRESESELGHRIVVASRLTRTQ
jgi:hypothetical protein